MVGRILFLSFGLSLLSIAFALTHGQAKNMLSGAGTVVLDPIQCE